MLRLRTAFFASLIALVAGTGGRAETILFADITNAAETPTPTLTTTTGQPRPASFGTAMFVLNDAQTAMTFTATITNIDFTGSQTADLNDNLLNAHIHAGATAVPGNTAPVVWGFFGSPFNDNNPNDQVVTPFTTGVGGTISGKWDAPEGNGTGVNLAAELPFILSGRSYINFHTVQNTGGELRGFLTVPEPSSIVLLGIGAVAFIGCGWRFRKRTR